MSDNEALNDAIVADAAAKGCLDPHCRFNGDACTDPYCRVNSKPAPASTDKRPAWVLGDDECGPIDHTRCDDEACRCSCHIAPTSTLVERLRRNFVVNPFLDMAEAADRIEGLERESASYEAEAGSERRRAASAEAERDEYRHKMEVNATTAKRAQSERDRLRAIAEQVLFACAVCRGEKATHIKNVDESIHNEIKRALEGEK